MIEKIGHIKNPLTVIAMFAGIAEVSGTIVLPFVTPATQGTYVWFLMIFPCLLVTLFLERYFAGIMCSTHLQISETRTSSHLCSSHRMVKDWSIPVQVRVFSMSELKSDFAL